MGCVPIGLDIDASMLVGSQDNLDHFGVPFYGAYYDINPSMPGKARRTAIYQLYYLLVHLNLFGRSYYRSVKEILNTHF